MAKTAQEYFDATRGGNYETGYDIVADVMTKHFPVVSGLVLFALVIMAPFVYDLYTRRKKSKPPIPPSQTKSSESEMAPQKDTLEKDKIAFSEIAQALEKSGEAKDDEYENNIVTKAGKIKDPAIRGEALSIVGAFYESNGEQLKALEFARNALFCFDLAKAKEDVKKSTEWISRLKGVS